MNALRSSVTAALAGLFLLSSAPARANDQQKADAAKVQQFAESLKAQDPEAFKRFNELREAKEKGLEALKKAQDALKSAQGEEKMNAYQEFKAARKKYAESYIAFLDFLDERDRKRMERIEGAIKKYQEAIENIKKIIEDRKKAREELDKAAKGE